MTTSCKIELIGNLDRTPLMMSTEKLRYGSFIVKTQHEYVNEIDGTTKKKTLYHRVVGFSKDAIKVIETLKHKDTVRLTGTLSYSQFETKDGFKKSQASIIAEEIEYIS